MRAKKSKGAPRKPTKIEFLPKKWQDTVKKIALYSGAATIISAVAGVAIAYIQTLFISQGDPKTAHIIISEVGIAYFWGWALMLITEFAILVCVRYFIIYLVCLLRDERLQEKARSSPFMPYIICFGALLSISVLLFWCSIFEMIFTVVFVIWVCSILRKARNDGASSPEAFAFASLYTIALMIPSSIIAGAYFQTGVLAYDDGTRQEVAIISDTKPYFLIKDMGSGNLKKVRSDFVADYVLCDFDDSFWLFESPFSLSGLKYSHIKKCQN